MEQWKRWLKVHQPRFLLDQTLHNSLRSRRKHKAWGASPRNRSQRQAGARENGRQRGISSLSPAVAGSDPLFGTLPWAYAPGFMLTPAIAG
jgi:hypothetical protein